MSPFFILMTVADLEQVKRFITPPIKAGIYIPQKKKEERIDANTDAPICECGTLMMKRGSCYSCPNCFASTGACQ